MKIFYLLIPLLFIVSPFARSGESVEFIDLGSFTQKSINNIINNGDSTETISEQFLGIPYLGHTLIGSNDKQEILTINLSGMDCFTYIDYVEAMRVSGDYSSFKDNVRKVRYKDGTVEYKKRNHFFSDWPAYNSSNVKDVTALIGGDDSVTVKKQLNLKKDGSYFLKGIPVTEREIIYIPTAKLTPEILSRITSGDYIGIYTNLEGLDVTHTGIIIKKEGRAYIRHASSREKNKKVLDEELLTYMENKPGLVIYRPL